MAGFKEKVRDLKRGNWIVFNIFLLSGLVVLLLLYNSYTHTPERNSNWQSSKTQLGKGVMGSWAFMLSYRALAKNRLDLGTWHGYHELFLKKPVTFSEASFDFRLDGEACLVFFFGKAGDTLKAIRISEDPQYESAYLEVVEGRFVRKESLKIPVINQSWNRFSMSFNGNRAVIIVNGSNDRITIPDISEGNCTGFRAYENPTLVDNIKLTDKGGNVVFSDKFNLKLTGWFWLMLVIILVNLMYISDPGSRRVLNVLVINISILITLLWLFFMIYGRFQYPGEWMIDWKSATSNIFPGDEPVAEDSVDLVAEDNSKRLKVLFLGSSQTWGAGATRESKTFVERFEYLVNRSNEQKISCINTGISGIRSDEILESYRNKWIHLNPDLCIINLSMNDSGNRKFRKNLEEIIMLNRRSGITTVLIPEPVMGYRAEHRKNQEIVKQLAKDHNLQLIDIQSYLDNHYDDGFLYWDFVHLTDFGQQLFAEEINRQFAPEFCLK